MGVSSRVPPPSRDDDPTPSLRRGGKYPAIERRAQALLTRGNPGFPCGPPPSSSSARHVLSSARARSCRAGEWGYCSSQAEVAELADAPDSKSGGLRAVWVRFPPSAYG